MSRAQRAGAALAALLLIGGVLVVALIISVARGQDRIAAGKSIDAAASGDSQPPQRSRGIA